MDPLVPVLQARWVTDSIRERRMLPLYSYLDDPAQNNLKHLSLEDRDVAELLKAKVGNPGDDIFNQLHQRVATIYYFPFTSLLNDFDSSLIIKQTSGVPCIRGTKL
jgi:hypothetical protein